jgi:hypothetical protein
MNKDFRDGLEFGCVSGSIWYLLWFGLAFFVAAKTHDFMYVFGTLSLSITIGLAGLNKLVRVFIKD